MKFEKYSKYSGDGPYKMRNPPFKKGMESIEINEMTSPEPLVCLIFLMDLQQIFPPHTDSLTSKT